MVSILLEKGMRSRTGWKEKKMYWLTSQTFVVENEFEVYKSTG